MRTFLGLVSSGEVFAVSAPFARDAGLEIKNSQAYQTIVASELTEQPLLIYPMSHDESIKAGLNLPPHFLLQIGSVAAGHILEQTSMLL